MIQTSSCYPLERVFRLPVWMADARFQFMRIYDRNVDTTMTILRVRINQWKVEDSIVHYASVNPLFYARVETEIDSIYLPVHVSICRIV